MLTFDSRQRSISVHMNSIGIHIPSPLRRYTTGKHELSVQAETVRGVLNYLKEEYSELYCSVCDETGAVRRHVNLFINDTRLAKTVELSDPLRNGDSVYIMPAVSGG